MLGVVEIQDYHLGFVSTSKKPRIVAFERTDRLLKTIRASCGEPPACNWIPLHVVFPVGDWGGPTMAKATMKTM